MEQNKYTFGTLDSTVFIDLLEVNIFIWFSIPISPLIHARDTSREFTFMTTVNVNVEQNEAIYLHLAQLCL